ncbi:ribonuclease H [Candidatus Magnetomorum sp. HK-1]|nr:ribonuclease H [Candidatus Magnetomorum sp. HK-1]
MKKKKNKDIRIYTDGACNPNPGPGGWGAVILYPNQTTPVEISGGEHEATNNRMELMAAIQALERFKEPHNNIVLYTDSKYIRKGITQWIEIWEKNGWQTSTKKAVKNQSLWKRLNENAKKHKVTWKWVKGHAGNKWNERADLLARNGVPEEIKSLPLEDLEGIHIFTAISYSSKDKIGGWASYLRFKAYTKSISGKIENTSSNRMHILAAVQGLQLIKKKYPIHLYTVSSYLKDGASLWVHNWQKSDWKTKEGKPVKHKDLWIALQKLTQSLQVTWHLVSKNHFPEEMDAVKDLARNSIKK